MAELLATLQSLFTFAFVVSSMLAMGLSLTLGQIIEPLRNLRLVLLALLANFVILIAGSNFADQPDVLVFLAGAGVIGMVIVMPLAAEFGRRAASAHDAPATDPGEPAGTGGG